MVMRELNQSCAGDSRVRQFLLKLWASTCFPKAEEMALRASELMRSRGFPAAVSWFGKSCVEETRHQFGNLCSPGTVRPGPHSPSSQDLGKHKSFFSLKGKQSRGLRRASETCCSWWGFTQPTCGYFPRKRRDIIAMAPCYWICLRLDINLLLLVRTVFGFFFLTL